MPHFDTIPLDDAKRQASATPGPSQYASYVGQLTAGQAGHLTLVPGDTMRAVKLRLTRAAKAAGVTLARRTVGDSELYFWLAAPKRGRPRKVAI